MVNNCVINFYLLVYFTCMHAVLHNYEVKKTLEMYLGRNGYAHMNAHMREREGGREGREREHLVD